MTWALLLANVAAYGWQLVEGHRSLLVGGAIPYELLTLQDTWPKDLVPPPFTILTSLFLHADPWHLAGNLLFLQVFAGNVEDALGRARFLAFYLGAGVVAAVTQVLATAVQAAPLAPGDATAVLAVPMVGASGAIAGVLGAHLVILPRARIQALVFFPLSSLAALLARRRGEPATLLAPLRLVVVPAWAFAGAWFLLQGVGILAGHLAGVAVFAHLGGFAAGLLVAGRLGRRAGWTRAAPRWA